MGLPAKKSCNQFGCPALVSPPTEHCEKHAKNNSKVTQERNRKNEPHHRLYDTYRWRYKLRPMKLRHAPYCESGVICDPDNIGRRAIATEVHHVKDSKQHPELFFVYENLLSVCHECHSHETALATEGFAKPTSRAA
jgi:5-methylcytosine-specific restriction protein A